MTMNVIKLLQKYLPSINIESMKSFFILLNLGIRFYFSIVIESGFEQIYLNQKRYCMFGLDF